MKEQVHVFAVVPVMDEWDNLQGFTNCLRGQTWKEFTLLVCVNQPEEWWNIPEKRNICENNRKTLEYFHRINDIRVIVTDRSSKGKGWQGKRRGVGWARKLIMDAASEMGNPNDLIISMDADTTFGSNYFTSVASTFNKHYKSAALAVPYYHRLAGKEEIDRLILRYEIYLRYYSVNLWRIKNPYCFTAIGSAMAFTVTSYKKVGGITPKLSGEDFYLMQKLCKSGRVVQWNPEKVYPEARFSDRVGFGTGPALLRGNKGNWHSYPIFPHPYFDEVALVFDSFSQLFHYNVATPMDEFLRDVFKEDNIWEPLRKNFKDGLRFARACAQKIDGLRIFQYLRRRNKTNMLSDEQSLLDFFSFFYGMNSPETQLLRKGFSFNHSPVELLDEIRDVLIKTEEAFQKNDFEQ